jgi:hypothetical protein
LISADQITVSCQGHS